MQPEISHRCQSCGASVRERAMFCPECGQALTPQPADSKPQDDPETSTPAVVESAAISSDESPAVTPLATSETSADDQPAPDVEAAPPKTESGNPANLDPAAKHGTYEKARGSLHRASTATREALADNVKRVEKIRHASSAMIEEASYDPSLRFVLVALVLFVIFLVLLLLSKVMG